MMAKGETAAKLRVTCILRHVSNHSARYTSALLKFAYTSAYTLEEAAKEKGPTRYRVSPCFIW